MVMAMAMYDVWLGKQKSVNPVPQQAIQMAKYYFKYILTRF